MYWWWLCVGDVVFVVVGGLVDLGYVGFEGFLGVYLF